MLKIDFNRFIDKTFRGSDLFGTPKDKYAKVVLHFTHGEPVDICKYKYIGVNEDFIKLYNHKNPRSADLIIDLTGLERIAIWEKGE